VVVCDDGSTDSTFSIIEEHASKDPRIKFFTNEKNLGLVGNWNRCIEKANGTWIKFLFQDDLMHPNCLEEMAKLTNAEVELITCKRNFLIDKTPTEDIVDYYSNRVRTLENTGHFTSSHFSAETISKIAIENPSMNFIAEPSLTMFRKLAVEKIGHFDPELKQICDLEFLLRVASVFGLRYIPKQLCSFRVHDSSTTEENVNSNNYDMENMEVIRYALKLLTKPEFKNFRSYIGSSGMRKLRIFVKFRFYKAFRAMRTPEDSKIFNDLALKNAQFMYKWWHIPVLKIYMLIK
jgi:glycosyltransferase involved in cell wall biosynthesis